MVLQRMMRLVKSNSYVDYLLAKKLAMLKEVLLSNTDKMIQIRITNEEGLVARRHKTIWLERLAVNTSAAELSSVARDLANFEKMLSIDLKQRRYFVHQSP